MCIRLVTRRYRDAGRGALALPQARFDALLTHILSSLRGGTYTAQQLANMTGYDLFEVRDALAVLCGTQRVQIDDAPRFLLPSEKATPRYEPPPRSLPTADQRVESPSPRAV